MLQTDEQYIAAWGGPSKVLGRVRLHDGLMTLHRFNQVSTLDFGSLVHGWREDDLKQEQGPKQEVQVLQGYGLSRLH